MPGVKPPSTVRRRRPCSGGSIERSWVRSIARLSGSGSSIRIEPRAAEKVSGSREAATTSACLVSAQ